MKRELSPDIKSILKENDICVNSKQKLKKIRNLMKYPPPMTEAHRTALNSSLHSVTLDFIDSLEVERRLNFARSICVGLESRIPDSIGTACKTSQRRELEVSSVVDPYDRGFFSALPEIFDVLCTAHMEEKRLDEDLPKFLDIRKTSVSKGFSIVIEDLEHTCFCITVGNPHGQDFAALIRTYLSIDDRAKHLMTLLLKFIQLASIEDLPKPALYVLVIFFLQRTHPPVLPNLHEISCQHRDTLSVASIETVKTEGGDSSYLKDLSVLPQFFSLGRNSMTVADMWLKFLRFYVFEFQSQSCIVSITHSGPIPRSSRKCNLLGLWVEHPFSPSTPLTKNLSRPVEKFIRDQLLAAYCYFAIPRLAKTGRPVFVNVLVHTIQPPREQAIKSPKSISLNFISSTDLGHHLNKFSNLRFAQVTSLFTAYVDNALVSQASSEVTISASTEATVEDKTLGLGDVLMETLRLAYGEICPADSVASIQRSCHKRASRYLRGGGFGIRLTSSQAIEFFRAYCRNLWQHVQCKYQNGSNHAMEGQLARIGERILTMTVRGMFYVLRKSPPAPNCNTEGEGMGLDISQSPDKLSPVMSKREPSCSEDGEGDVSRGFQEADVGQGDKSTYISDDPELSTRNVEPIGNVLNDVCNIEEVELAEKMMNARRDCIGGDGLNGASGDPWSKYIKMDTDIVIFQDSNKPGYYSSTELNLLKSEDLSFSFTVRPSYGAASYSPILGSDASDQPSSMIAHPWHCNSSCAAEPHDSVSMSLWKKLESKVPRISNQTHLHDLSDCLIQLSRFHSSQEIMSFRQVVVTNLNKLFRAVYPDVSLKLFGSCANGFETSTSDMDICIVFPPDSPQASSLLDDAERLKLLKTFRRLLGKGSRNLGISNIRPVYFAKVPIIKFTISDCFEVDLSFSNFLAINNTEMLNFYNRIDSRLRVLNIALKIVLKVGLLWVISLFFPSSLYRFSGIPLQACKVPKSDAGGISSYAFAIMLIHYLQQKDFLPVLQEASSPLRSSYHLYEGNEKPVISVGRWNVWYQSDMEMVHKLWKPPEEDVSVADLWFGFLRYYLFEFDRERYVVTIKQKSRLDRLGKLWESLLAVEGRPDSFVTALAGILLNALFFLTHYYVFNWLTILFQLYGPFIPLFLFNSNIKRAFSYFFSPSDPFNLHHNLTNYVGRKVLSHVLNSLYNTLLHHTTFVRDQLTPNQWKFYLFSEEKLNPNNQLKVIKKSERKDRPSNGVQTSQANLTPALHSAEINGVLTPSNAVLSRRPRKSEPFTLDKGSDWFIFIPRLPGGGRLPANGTGVNRAAANLSAPSNRARTSNHQQQYRRSQHVVSAPFRGGTVGHRGAGAGVYFARGAENRSGIHRSRGRGQRRNA
ncbi:unnamed protein product [Hydatigera taeniaeformis]|uniref:RNA uridylyltransferase n=1 Tax=Hydatigena taeniaeformis TaxID=6205 RepID=A0A0R3X293_HYDTA|nr:unnamed protein product [Hydatigera taeniaeformis]